MNKKKDIIEFFGDDFEVTFEEDIPEVQADVKDDAYKDALSALSELDDTHSFDYLEMNKTKTIRLDEYLESQKNDKEEKNGNPLKKFFNSLVTHK